MSLLDNTKSAICFKNSNNILLINISIEFHWLLQLNCPLVEEEKALLLIEVVEQKGTFLPCGRLSSSPLTEPCLRYSRTRLLLVTIHKMQLISQIQILLILLSLVVLFPFIPTSECSKCFPSKGDNWQLAFPPSALPNFIGTTLLSDSLHSIWFPCFLSLVHHTLLTRKDRQGLPSCRIISMCNVPRSLTPERFYPSCP